MSAVAILAKNAHGAFDELSADRLAEIDPANASPGEVVWVSVDRPDGRRCDLAFDYQRVPDKLVSIGPLACREVQP